VVIARLVFRHDLNAETPLREVAVFDLIVEIALRALAVFTDDFLRLSIRDVLYALHRLEMELHVVTLILCVDERERVRTETMHLPVILRNAAITHEDGDLMQRLGRL
jgi:hypothetical protein